MGHVRWAPLRSTLFPDARVDETNLFKINSGTELTVSAIISVRSPSRSTLTISFPARYWPPQPCITQHAQPSDICQRGRAVLAHSCALATALSTHIAFEVGRLHSWDLFSSVRSLPSPHRVACGGAQQIRRAESLRVQMLLQLVCYRQLT